MKSNDWRTMRARDLANESDKRLTRAKSKNLVMQNPKAANIIHLKMTKIEVSKKGDNLLDHLRFESERGAHDILLVRVEHHHVSGYLLPVPNIVDCERVGKAEVKDCNGDGHDPVNARKVHGEEIGRIKQINCAHDHRQICRLVPIQLLHAQLPPLAQQVKDRNEDSIADSDD